jgi:5-methyltetrahydrofolate--homocysteine methyltransferase
VGCRSRLCGALGLGHDQKGNNDILALTRPDVPEAIHRAYFEAGADIAETNTFSANRISQADYGAEHLVRDINVQSARIARRVADEFTAATAAPASSRARLGRPTRRCRCRPTSTIPASARSTSTPERRLPRADRRAGRRRRRLHPDRDHLRHAERQGRDQGALEAGEALGRDLPIMLSMTITDLSGRNLSGHTVEAFWHAVRHARPVTIGLNCSFGAEQLRPHVRTLADNCDALVMVYPNAGLPNDLGAYDEAPETTAGWSANGPESGQVNILGGCCGSTPSISAPSPNGARLASARPPASAGEDPAAGLEPDGDRRVNVASRRGSSFVNIGERTNVTGSAKFKKLILAGDYDAAVEVARDQVENGAQVIDVNMDEALLDGELAMTTFLKRIAAEPDIARVPVMIDSSKWSVIEAGLKCVSGKPIVNSISMKEGEEPFLAQARACMAYGAAVVVMAFDEVGQADTARAQGRDLRARLQAAHRHRLPARGHHLRPQRLRRRDGDRGA